MPTKIEIFNKSQIKKDLPDVRPGDIIRVSQKILSSAPSFAKATADKSADKKEGERIQIFEGLVIARKHGKEMGSTITVRRVIGGVGVEKIFPLHLPSIEKIEVIKKGRVKRAKLYYLRTAKGKRAKLKQTQAVEG